MTSRTTFSSIPGFSSMLDELAHRIRERGVRVDERLALLRVLAGGDAAHHLSEKREKLLSALERAAKDVERELM